MNRPKLVVLAGQVAFERMGGLINSMVNRPNDLDPIGRAMVNLMADTNSKTGAQIADELQPFLRRYYLKGNIDDPHFDQRIMIEAVTFGAKMFSAAWKCQVPMLHCEDYRFKQWMGHDLVLELR